MKKIFVLFSCVGLILLFLLAIAAGNTNRLNRFFDLLFWLNIAILSGLSLFVGVRLWQLRQRVKAKFFGSRLSLRLVLMFSLIAILPGTLVYTISVQFLNRSIETWFDLSVDRALDRGLDLSRTAINYQLDGLVQKAKFFATDLGPEEKGGALISKLTRIKAQTDVQTISLFDENGTILAHISNENGNLLPDDMPEYALHRQILHEPYKKIENPPGKPLSMRVIIPLPSPHLVSSRYALLQLIQPVPLWLANDVELVNQVRSEYKQRSQARNGLRLLFTLTLTVALLMALLSALALAIYLSNRLAGPLSALAAGTQAIIQGDYSQQQPVTSHDELGILTHSFNRMTRQLAEARASLEHYQAEQAAEKAYVEAILGSLSSGVLSFDENWILCSHNESALRILNINPHSLPTLPLHRWAEIDPDLATFSQLAVSLQAQPKAQHQVQIGESRCLLLVRGTPLTTSVLGLGGFVLVFDEITDLIAAQRDAAWGEVARRLAHEIKNPLTPIQLAAEQLEQKLSAHLVPIWQELLARNTRTIVEQVRALKQMVDAFRDYARPSAGRKKRLDLQHLLDEVLVLYENSPILREDKVGGPLMILGDATSLRQVIHNLLQNAQDAIRESPEQKIILRTEVIEQNLVLTFEDSGTGFAQDMLKVAFEPYITTKTKGTGLGLAIVKKIVEEHQGHIQVGNRPKGGAFIQITLPIAEKQRA